MEGVRSEGLKDKGSWWCVGNGNMEYRDYFRAIRASTV